MSPTSIAAQLLWHIGGGNPDVLRDCPELERVKFVLLAVLNLFLAVAAGAIIGRGRSNSWRFQLSSRSQLRWESPFRRSSQCFHSRSYWWCSRPVRAYHTETDCFIIERRFSVIV